MFDGLSLGRQACLFTRKGNIMFVDLLANQNVCIAMVMGRKSSDHLRPQEFAEIKQYFRRMLREGEQLPKSLDASHAHCIAKASYLAQKIACHQFDEWSPESLKSFMRQAIADAKSCRLRATATTAQCR